MFRLGDGLACLQRDELAVVRDVQVPRPERLEESLLVASKDRDVHPGMRARRAEIHALDARPAERPVPLHQHVVPGVREVRRHLRRVQPAAMAEADTRRDVHCHGGAWVILRDQHAQRGQWNAAAAL